MYFLRSAYPWLEKTDPDKVSTREIEPARGGIA